MELILTKILFYCLGMSSGAVGMWFCFAKAKLLRSRDEYYRAINYNPGPLMQRRMEEEIARLITEKRIALANFTREQTADAFIQAIKCGDFERHVLAGSDASCVVYIPYAREQELMTKIKGLELLLEEERKK